MPPIQHLWVYLRHSVHLEVRIMEARVNLPRDTFAKCCKGFKYRIEMVSLKCFFSN